MKEIHPAKKLSDIAIFDVVFNVQLGGKLLKLHYPKLIVMCCVEHTVLLFFNDASKISIFQKMISAHKVIYTISGLGNYHKPHPIFKSKYKELHNRSIDTFIGNDGRIFCGNVQRLVDSKISSIYHLVCRNQYYSYE